MPAPAAPKEPDPSETRVAAVKQVLDTKLAQYGGTWSAPYIDLESGRDVTVNDEKLVAASLVKLYIMLAVFDGIEHDTITDDANVDALLKQMITVSSNEAANGCCRASATATAKPPSPPSPRPRNDTASPPARSCAH